MPVTGNQVIRSDAFPWLSPPPSMADPLRENLLSSRTSASRRAVVAPAADRFFPRRARGAAAARRIPTRRNSGPSL